MPPAWMWPYEDELEIWFENVEEQRKEKYGGGGSTAEDTDAPLMRNELSPTRR